MMHIPATLPLVGLLTGNLPNPGFSADAYLSNQVFGKRKFGSWPSDSDIRNQVFGSRNFANSLTPVMVIEVTTPTIKRRNTGSAQTIGNAVLVAGTVTVNTTAALAGSYIMLTRKTAGGTIGTAITYTISAGTSFTINSDNPLDTSTFTWQIFDGV